MTQPISEGIFTKGLMETTIEGEHYVRVCSRCGVRVEVSPLKDYDYYCPNHDEDLFSFETEFVLDKDVKV